MNSPRHHRHIEFAEKIRRIQQGAEERLTPAEFILYLLETHKERGQLRPITQSEFSSKCCRSGNPDYFSQYYSTEQPGGILPKVFVIALTTLTNQPNPFFWEAPGYSLADAKDIRINMNKILFPASTIKRGSRLLSVQKTLQELPQLATAILLDETTGGWKHGTCLMDANGQVSWQFRNRNRALNFENYMKDKSPEEAVLALTSRRPGDKFYQLKGQVLRAVIKEAVAKKLCEGPIKTICDFIPLMPERANSR